MRAIVEGKLYQGDIGDLNVLKIPETRDRLGFTLAVNVGHTPFVPRGVRTIYLIMQDRTGYEANPWDLILDVAALVAGEILRGGKVLVTCDAGLSRSVVFCGIVLAFMERRPMDAELFDRVSTDFTLPELWDNAARAIALRAAPEAKIFKTFGHMETYYTRPKDKRDIFDVVDDFIFGED